jgi:hypothetical protein
MTMMMRLLSLAVLLSAASAFVGQTAAPKSSAVSAIAPEKEVGVLPPIGFFE